MRLKSILVLVLIALILPLSSWAQLNDDLDVSILVSPPTPGPNTKVTLRINDYSSDIASADIRWSVNGKLSARGPGLVSFNFTTGAVGGATTVTVEITPKGGLASSQTLTFRPATINLILSADSYVPPFYRGRALPGNENDVRIVAIPLFYDGTSRLPYETLDYNWQNDFEPLPDQSGVGRNVLSLKTVSIFGDTTVKLTVTSPGGSIEATKLITISPVNPGLLLYLVDPLAGINYDRPLASRMSMEDQELTLEAVPFFFPAKHRAATGLQYSFSINGKRATTNINSPQRITLRQEGEAVGNATVGVSVTDPFDSLITAARNISIALGGNNSFQ